MRRQWCGTITWFAGIFLGVWVSPLPAAAAEAAVLPSLVLDRCGNDASLLTIEIEDITDLQGYQAEITLDESILQLPTDNPYGFAEGSFLGSNTYFQVTKLEQGRYRVIETKLGPPGADGTGPLFTITGDPAGETGSDAHVAIVSIIARNHLNQSIQVDLGNPAVVRVDCTSPNVTVAEDLRTCFRGSGANDPVIAVLGATDSGGIGADLDRVETQVVPGTSDCDPDGTWDILADSLTGLSYGPAETTLPDPPSPGEWTYHARAFDDAGNVSECVSFTFRYLPDTTAAVTNLTAETRHRSVALSWTTPGLATGQEVWIVRKTWNADSTSGFPGYEIGGALAGGAYPQAPTDGRVVLRTATLSSFVDTVGVVATTPDIYLYRGFVVDCLDYQNGGAAPSDISADFTSENLEDAADAATNYWLGDIDDALGPPYEQDGSVTSVDLAALSGSMGTNFGESGYIPEADFGPPEMPDGSPTGVARPDLHVDFEDVIILSINYGSVGPLGDDPVVLGPSVGNGTPPSVDLRVTDAGIRAGRIVAALVRLENGEGIRGIRTLLRYDPLQLEPIDAQAGDAILARPDVTFHSATLQPGAIDLCTLTLGPERGFEGSGVVYRVTFRSRTASPARISLEGTKIRDLQNREIGGALGRPPIVPLGNEATRATEGRASLEIRPNPFAERTEIDLRVEGASKSVDVRIVDAGGRLVRSLHEGMIAPGAHLLAWDGRDEMGRRVRSGVYFCETRTGMETIRRKIILIR